MKVIHWFNAKTRQGGHGEPLEDAIARAQLEEMEAKKDGFTYWLETPNPKPISGKVVIDVPAE